MSTGAPNRKPKKREKALSAEQERRVNWALIRISEATAYLETSCRNGCFCRRARAILADLVAGRPIA